MPGLIVIGYDGSADAQRAVEVAGLLQERHALIVNVWLPGLVAATPIVPLGASVPPSPELDEQLEAQAHEVVAEGVARAASLGLRAEAVVIEGDAKARTGERLAELAEERDAAAIVVGRRGVSRLEAVILGSVSDATIRSARCPVLVAPAAED